MDEALRWLVAHQRPDASWAAGRSIYDTGVTAIALLALLGAGHAPAASEPFGKAVYRGLRHLCQAQDHEGCFGPRSSARYVYNHAWATLAMVEAYGVRRSSTGRFGRRRDSTSPPTPQPLLRVALRYPAAAKRHLRHRRRCCRRSTRRGASTPTSGTRGAIAPPSSSTKQAFDGARAWLDRATDPDTGRVGYVTRGGRPFRPQGPADRFPADLSEAPTAMGLWMHAMMGVQARARVVAMARELLRARPPVWEPETGGIDLIYWYYATYALHHFAQNAWRRWERALLPVLLDNQRKDTTHDVYRGSWDPAGAWGPRGARVRDGTGVPLPGGSLPLSSVAAGRRRARC